MPFCCIMTTVFLIIHTISTQGKQQKSYIFSAPKKLFFLVARVLLFCGFPMPILSNHPRNMSQILTSISLCQHIFSPDSKSLVILAIKFSSLLFFSFLIFFSCEKHFRYVLLSMIKLHYDYY